MDPPTNDHKYQPDIKPVSSLLNTNIDVGLDVLRKEFSKVGKGTFELRKDEETGIALLTINNVERRNSLSGLMMAQFNVVLTQLEEWKEVMYLSIFFHMCVRHILSFQTFFHGHKKFFNFPLFPLFTFFNQNPFIREKQ